MALRRGMKMMSNNFSICLFCFGFLSRSCFRCSSEGGEDGYRLGEEDEHTELHMYTSFFD